MPCNPAGTDAERNRDPRLVPRLPHPNRRQSVDPDRARHPVSADGSQLGDLRLFHRRARGMGRRRAGARAGLRLSDRRRACPAHRRPRRRRKWRRPGMDGRFPPAPWRRRVSPRSPICCVTARRQRRTTRPISSCRIAGRRWRGSPSPNWSAARRGWRGISRIAPGRVTAPCWSARTASASWSGFSPACWPGSRRSRSWCRAATAPATPAPPSSPTARLFSRSPRAR